MDPDAVLRTEQQIEWALGIRRARSEILGQALFADPAWDIMLQLFQARLRGRQMKLTDLVTDAPLSTLVRWAAVLEEHGLITGYFDPLIPSILRIELSERGAAKMARLFHTQHHSHPAG